MEAEIWKSIINYEGLYEVSNLGNVRSMEHIIKCKEGHYQKIDDLDILDEFMAQMKQYEKEIGQEFEAVWRKIQDADSETSHLTDKELGLLDKYQDLKPYLFLLRKDKEQECLDKIWQKIKPTNMI